MRVESAWRPTCRRAGMPCRPSGAPRRICPVPSCGALCGPWPRRSRGRRGRGGRRRAARSGQSAMIAPTSRSRAAQPSRRRPMPGASESSTVEWHSAQVMPTQRNCWPVIVEESAHADDRIELEECKRRGGIVEIDTALAQRFPQLRRQGIGVHLEPERKRRLRAQAGTDATICASGDGLVQTQRVTPESLVAESVLTEYPASAFHHLERVVELYVDPASPTLLGSLCQRPESVPRPGFPAGWQLRESSYGGRRTGRVRGSRASADDYSSARRSRTLRDHSIAALAEELENAYRDSPEIPPPSAARRTASAMRSCLDRGNGYVEILSPSAGGTDPPLRAA